jgi:hypothetical protein
LAATASQWRDGDGDGEGEEQDDEGEDESLLHVDIFFKSPRNMRWNLQNIKNINYHKDLTISKSLLSQACT